jgi:hypothetical protein
MSRKKDGHPKVAVPTEYTTHDPAGSALGQTAEVLSNALPPAKAVTKVFVNEYNFVANKAVDGLHGFLLSRALVLRASKQSAKGRELGGGRFDHRTTIMIDSRRQRQT